MTDRQQIIQVVEDDASVQASLTVLLRGWGYAVVSFTDAETCLHCDASARCDCILLDVRLPGMDGLSLLDELRRRGVATPVIMLTGHGDVDMAVRALKSGAQDFLEKPFGAEDLIRRIRAAVRGPAAGMSELRAQHPFGSLTPRETQVMQEIVAGHSSKVIAHRLGLSPKTIEVHRSRVMKKTGAANVSQLVRMVVKAGLDPDTVPADTVPGDTVPADTAGS